MADLGLTCSACGGALWAEGLSAGTVPCSRCAALVRVVAFPALLRPPAQGSAAAAAVPEVDATCFDHPDKRAAATCDGCGRFLCDLCDLPVGGRHLCPACLEAGRGGAAAGPRSLESQRLLYDNLALTLAVLPMLLLWPTLVCAPAVLYLAVRYRGAPGSILPRRGWRWPLAVAIAGLQILGWASLVALLLFTRFTRFEG